MKKNKKPFDAVRMMRQIRDALSEEFKGMTFDEQKQYIDAHLRGKATKAQPNPDYRDSEHPRIPL